MIQETKLIAIDAGNTSIKAGCFKDGNLIEVKRFSLESLKKLAIWYQSMGSPAVVLSSVLSKNNSKAIEKLFTNCLSLDKSYSFPLPIKYQSFDTLGMDRLCNASYCFNHLTSEYAVSIDIGTCIKFDLISKKEGYIGGSISPGIDLRFKSLNDYTGKLPLLSNKSKVSLVGSNTESSIYSGVLNGIQAEIDGFILKYEMDFKDLTFFMTGGDASNFDIHSKNNIFADENLTIKGLYEIYKQNA